MVLVAVGSIGGSPGVTTLCTALAAQWPRECVVVEADPDGGRLAARLELGVRPGLTDLGAACRKGGEVPEDALWRFAQRSSAGVVVVPSHPGADQVQALLRGAAEPLANWCVTCRAHDVIADVGRLRPGSPAAAIVRAAHRRLVVVRAEAEDVVALVHRRELLTALGGVEVVLVRGAYAPREVADALPWPVVAAIGAGRGSARARRRAVRRLAADLAADIAPDATADRGADAAEAREPAAAER
ncbi:MAG: hypothetical protein IPM43_08320 [Actinomycetota bacterium]|nr:MAG: hypothetical protein IPM43_08320 [Actinomycetota bacterium]